MDNRITSKINFMADWATGLNGISVKFIAEKNNVMYYVHTFNNEQMGCLAAIATQAYLIVQIDKKPVTKAKYFPLTMHFAIVMKGTDQELKHQLKDTYYVQPESGNIFTELQIEGEITRTDFLRLKTSTNVTGSGGEDAA